MNEFKLFGKWSMDVEVEDPGLKRYINLKPILASRIAHGRQFGEKYGKKNVNILERFMNHLFIPGHSGKKHRITSGRCCGSSLKAYKILKKCFERIEKKKKKNPVEIFVKAVENSAPYEEISAYKLGGMIARKAVITSPQRRLDLALRFLVQGAYKNKFNSKGMVEALRNEILLAYEKKKESKAIAERERREREASDAR